MVRIPTLVISPVKSRSAATIFRSKLATVPSTVPNVAVPPVENVRSAVSTTLPKSTLPTTYTSPP